MQRLRGYIHTNIRDGRPSVDRFACNEDAPRSIRGRSIMGEFSTYADDHKSSQCDKCLKDVGYTNLEDVPFLYLDRNDDMHKEVMPGSGYRQYRVCKECMKREVERINR